MRIYRPIFALALLLLPLCYCLALSATLPTQNKPAIQQATPYKTVAKISHYWVSEKLDGIRGYWDGKQLLTKQGNPIASPRWFTKNWPVTAIDGELWFARDQFQATMSCVLKISIDESCWQKIRFMIFDLPNHHGTFTERITTMQQLTAQINSPYLVMIKQYKIKQLAQLEHELNKVIAAKGEGLMLHYANAYYHAGRSSNIMKLKKHQDAEAKVIAHISGKGKYQGMLGALQVKTSAGVIFRIGSGFSDIERANPPPIGSIVTFKYNGITQAGIPRFARFWRVRSQQ